MAADYSTEDERGEFAAWIARNSESGDVIPGSGGCRKTRWTRKGMGKRGGVRIIFFNRLANGEVLLLLIYSKNVRENIPGHLLQQIKEEIEHG
ncbi:MAG: transcriptional regulator [Candidatus Muproteobacteria bacterium RBG_16_60_9]|uniref:Transcriptional regulator n=1 Tax=Candidatus Muproteobacteria bacterium RBG_16_60_9 TaxID=1817755 RepID=A0A1F6V5D5_9PROT|nr:MAG: transcriptional regulator [Candidatus Muproteobacteria bacterium RBG_16_60_9]